MGEITYSGVGIAVVGIGLRYALPTVPRWAGWVIVVAGILIAGADQLPMQIKPPLSSLACALGSVLFAVAAVHLYLTRPAEAQATRKHTEIAQVTDKPTIQNAPGGIINNQSGGTSNNNVYNFGTPYPPRQFSEPAYTNAREQVLAATQGKKVTVEVPLGSPQETLALHTML